MAVEPLLGTRAQRAFIATITIQAIVVLVMIGITFGMVEAHVNQNMTTSLYKTLPCYLALFALAEIFEFIMAIDALRARNVIQLIGILVFHLALMVFAALQVHQTHTALVQQNLCDAGQDDFLYCGGPGTLWKRVEPLLIVAPCIIAASWIAMLFWVKELYAEFGWAIFHVVGANPKMKSMYQWYQIMICLLKFDFFCFTGVTMQLLIVVLNKDSAEFGITIAAIPVVLALLAMCGIAVQREIKLVMSISLVLMVAAMSYLFKLVRFYEPSTQGQYVSTRATLTTFTIVAFLLLFGTFAVGLRCFADFDRGLQSSKVQSVNDSMTKKYSSPAFLQGGGNMSERQTSYMGGAPMGNRISIE